MRDARFNVNRYQLRQKVRITVIERHIKPVERILGKEIKVKPKDVDRYFTQQLLLPLPIAKDLSVFEYAKLTEQLPVESPAQVLVESTRLFILMAIWRLMYWGMVSSTDDVSEEGIPGKHLRTFKGKSGKQGLEKVLMTSLRGLVGGKFG